MPFWVPNLISVLRVALVPLFFTIVLDCVVTEGDQGGSSIQTGRAWAVTVLVLIWLSDLLDGYLARKFDLTSSMGAIVDAVADKLVQLALITFFALDHGPLFPRMPLWFVASIFIRDLVILYGSLLVRSRIGTMDSSHRFHGRVSTGFVLAAILATTLNAPSSWLTPLFMLGSLSALVSILGYIRVGREQVRE